MFDTHMGSAATFWAGDASVFVTAYRPADNSAAWLDYIDGLTDTYQSWDLGPVVDRSRLNADGCALFWLLHDLEGQCLGGVRVEGPFPQLERYGGFGALSTSPDVEAIVSLLGRGVGEGLAEFKGTWTVRGRADLGPVLARCMQHSLWWLDLPRGFYATAPHAQSVWESAGARVAADVRPAAYPTDDYETSLLFWGEDHELLVSEEQQRAIALERRYLVPARDRDQGHNTSAEWHPELLFDFDHRLDELARSGVKLIDHLDLARAELCDLLPSVGDRFHGEPSHWVYLPWRGVALHLPGPNAFWRLRTDRNRHKLDEADLEALRRREVGVVGMSVGSSTAHLLAQEGLCGALRLADYDALEITNLNRLSASIAELGVPKVWIAARRIAELDPYLPVTIHDEGVDHTNLDEFLEGLDVVIEECDALDMKLVVREAARRRRVPVIMETSDRGLLDVERFDLEPDRPLLHGLMGAVDVASLRGLSTDEKVPHVVGLLEPGELSASMAASMIEVDASTRSWPQLASDVAIGSSLVANAVRRLFTEPDHLASGRARLDIGAAVDALHEPTGEPWRNVKVAAAPVEHPVLPDRFTDALMAAAALAPSSGNMQPWRFEFSPTTFCVAVEPGERSGMDIGDRGSAVACGAALANAMAVAAARSRLSYRPDALDLSLDLDQPDVVGRVHLGNETDAGWAGLASYVSQRATNRMPGPSAPLSPEVVEMLQAAAAEGGGRCLYLPTHQLGDLVDLWAESDRVRHLTPRLHTEMMGEIRRPGIDALEDGLDERTLELTASEMARLKVLRRPDVMSELDRLDLGTRLGDDTRKRLDRSSGLVIMVVGGRTRTDYVRGGVALQRLWLTATRLGLWLHPMSPVFGYAQTPEELADVVGSHRASRLYRLSRMAYRQLGIGDDESFVLSARIHAGLPPTAVSQRRPTTARVAPFAAQNTASFAPV
ncbi:MAG: Rv1355c family protein [Actinomycetota bacterium]